jgi:hypothetical protein
LGVKVLRVGENEEVGDSGIRLRGTEEERKMRREEEGRGVWGLYQGCQLGSEWQPSHHKARRRCCEEGDSKGCKWQDW